MKISLIGPTYPYRGGISHHTTLLFENLSKKHDVLFITFKRQYPKILYPGKTDIDPSKFAFKPRGALSILDSINPLTWIKTAIKIIYSKPDLVIFPWWVAFWTPQFYTISTIVKKFTSAKILFICHNVVEHESSLLKKFMTRLVLKKGDFFIVHSKDDQNNLNYVVNNPNVKLCFLPNFDILKIDHLPSKEDAKHELGLDNKDTILFFGFIRPYKGLLPLIQIMPKLIEQKPDLRLLIVGEFWKDKDLYYNLINTLNIQRFLRVYDGYIPNEQVPKYFCASDFVVLPYKSATGSAIVQMAYNFNKPVVATKVGSLSDVVMDGVTGYLVDKDNPEQLIQAILKMFENRKFMEFEKNIPEIEKNFSWDTMINSIESFFK